MSATMVGPRRKISKLHWLNTLKQSPKNWNLDQEINFSKPHIWSLPFHFRFSSRMSSQSQQKLAKNITHFTIPFCSKNLTYFTNLNCFNIVKKIFPQHSKKLAHFTKFPANMFLVVVKKKNLHCTISRSQRTAFSNHWESIPVYVRKKLLSGGWLNNFLKAARCLRLVRFFILIESFANSTVFRAFWCFHQ